MMAAPRQAIYLTAFAVVAVYFLIWPAWRAQFPLEIWPTESWSAYFDVAAAHGRTIYPPQDQLVANATSGRYTKVPMTRTFPVYITYFTMAQNINGKLTTFRDIYGRDAPVLASFDQPRVASRARVTSEKVEAIEAPGA